MKNKVDYRIVVISLVALCAVALFVQNYTFIPKKEFMINGYYVGTPGERTDPRQTYNSYLGSKTEFDNSCITVAVISENAKMTETQVAWVVEGQTLSGEVASSIPRPDSDPLAISPFKDGDKIIAPSYLKFKNSNIMQNSYDNICIQGDLGNGVSIEFTGIKSWFCHMDKDIQMHNSVVGDQGKVSEVSMGTVIGKANEGTQVKLYKEQDGVVTQIDALEYFKN